MPTGSPELSRPPEASLLTGRTLDPAHLPKVTAEVSFRNFVKDRRLKGSGPFACTWFEPRKGLSQEEKNETFVLFLS